MTTLLSLDPGETTGWSLWEYDSTYPLTHLEHGMIGHGADGFAHWYKSLPERPDKIVCEDFILDGRTATPNTTPLNIIGMLQLDRPDLILQRNTVKSTIPDRVLKQVGLWWPGAGHDRDSARHALAFMRIARHRPTINHYYPRRTV